MSGHFLGLVPGIIVGLVVCVVFYYAGKAIRVGVRHFYRGERRGQNIGLVMGRLAHGIMAILGLLIGAAVAFPSITPESVVGFLGIGSVAIGFAFRDVLQNYLAGILLLLTQPFRIGDQIIFKNYEGTVEDIQTRATFIKTYDGRRVVIPNGELFTNSVTVNTAYPIRRMETVIGIGMDEDVDRAREIILNGLSDMRAAIDEPPPEVLTWDLGESAVNLHVRWWIRPPQMRDALDARDRVIAGLKERLLASGVEIPYPTRDLHIRRMKEIDNA